MFNKGIDIWTRTHDSYLRWGSGNSTVWRLPNPDWEMLRKVYGDSPKITANASSSTFEAAVKPPTVDDVRQAGQIGASVGAALEDLKKDAAVMAVQGSLGTQAEEGSVLFDPAAYFAALEKEFRIEEAPVMQRIKGECTETLRDLPHAQFGLGGLLQVAELAWQQVGGRRGVWRALGGLFMVCSVQRVLGTIGRLV
jgi:hypothetical protein